MKDNWAGDLAAGIGNGLAYLPLIVVVAFIAFGSLGPATAAVMSTSVFAAVLVAGAVLPVLARSPILIAVPSASSALVTGGCLAGSWPRAMCRMCPRQWRSW